MELKVDIQDGIVLLNPVGDLVNHTAPIFKAERTRLMEEGYKKFVLDMASVGLLSSIGIREIIALLKECQSKGGGMCLVNLTTQVEDILETTGLMQVVQIEGSVDEAKTALS